MQCVGQVTLRGTDSAHVRLYQPEDRARIWEGSKSDTGLPVRQNEPHPRGDRGHDGLDGMFGSPTGDKPLAEGRIERPDGTHSGTACGIAQSGASS